MKLYNILTKGTRTDSFYELLFYNYLSNDTPTIYEYTGNVPYTFTSNGADLLDWYITGNSGGVGERTANLLNKTDYREMEVSGNSVNNKVINETSITFTSKDTSAYSGVFISQTSYPIYIDNFDNTIDYTISADITTDAACVFRFIASANTFNLPVGTTRVTYTGKANIDFIFYVVSEVANIEISKIMIASTNTTVYELYGYKIPVICGEETTNIYINSPLDASDTISMSDTNISIPTVQGSNTISIDTTVQPTEVYIKYIGG